MFWNKKIVLSPCNHGMCENRYSINHKKVIHAMTICIVFKKGKFNQKYVVYLTS